MREEDEEVLAEVIRNETIPGVGVMDVSEADTLPICRITRAWLQGLKASEASSRGRPKKYSVEAVRDAAIEKAKPIEDPTFLICQLQLHERLHQKHTSGEIPKTMLSLYLECTEASRTRLLAEIIAEMENEGDD